MKRLLMCACAVLAVAGRAEPVQAADQLERVVILMRHGVRSAMASPEDLGRSTARPWPAFDVPPGHLTAKGARLVTLMGHYYRDIYTEAGLLSGDDCDSVYYWANLTQRTERTAAALAEGLTPGCAVTIHQADQGPDPLFDAPLAGVGPVDPARVRAAILGRVGGDLAAWDRRQAQNLATLEALLLQCGGDGCQAQEIPPGVRRLSETPIVDGLGDADHLVALNSPAIATGGLMESLLMGYAQGLDFESLGWTGLDAPSLTRAFAVHAASIDLRTRTPEVGRQTSSHLAARLLATLQHGAARATVADPLGGEARLIVLAGHDGTLTMLAGLLGLDWLLPSYGPNQAAPGGGLVFELWRGEADTPYVRVRYIAQGLDQLRWATPLSPDHPPEIASIFPAGCRETTAGQDCTLDGFADLVTERIDPRFVRTGD